MVMRKKLTLEDDGDEYVLWGWHELKLYFLLATDQEEELHAFEVFGAEVFEDLFDDLGFHLGSQGGWLLLYEHIPKYYKARPS